MLGLRLIGVKRRPTENHRSGADIDIFARHLVATFVYVDLV